MPQLKILTQIQLKKNHKGTFCADIKVEGQEPWAYLSDKVIEGGRLYTDPLEGSHYWASISLTKIGLFINQLLPLSKSESQSSKLPYYGRCQLLEDGRVKLSHEASKNEDSWDITLPRDMLSNFAYRIFHNSQIIVTFGHNNSGFFIKEWQTEHPSDIDKGVITNIRKKSEDVNYYLADYYVNEKAFLPVTVPKVLIKKLGIDSVTEQAVLPASISFNEEHKTRVSLPVSPERLLAIHNQPVAAIIFVKTELIEKEDKVYELYRFVTQWVEGIRLIVKAWPSELEHFIEEVSSLQAKATIKVHLSYYMNKEWCNFKLSVAEKDEYHERFRCITTKFLNSEVMTLLVTVKPPYNRVLVTRSELIKKGLYAIHSGVEFDLHIKRAESKKPWQIKDIDKGLFVGVDSDKAYKAECTVVNDWSRYDNHPDYAVKIERDQKSYALKNHAIASIRSKHVDLALIIPKSLLIARGFRTLDVGKKLTVDIKAITFPVFTTEVSCILCADSLKDSGDSQGDTGAGVSAVVLAEYTGPLPDHIGKKPPYKATPKYGFSIIGSDDSAIFIDWEHQMSQVDEPEKYRYKVRTEASKWGIEVKELISASIK
ncbi:hypothetical protein [uncultured Psychrobacter sp.]|uniref:hypothetical protein n=1 Tax=uncultured Psychrobacter sp. TaxID=259303 RepID=UPI00345AD434